MKRAMIATWLATAACSTSLKEPSPVETYAPGQAQGRSATELIAAANAAWAHRNEPGNAKVAQGLYLDAAVVDDKRIDALLGAMRALSYRIENEPGAQKEKLAQTAVELGQWCQRRAPTERECDYRLAIALGQYAREHLSSARDASNRMVDLLKRAAAEAPRIDEGGPDRVLALVLLRAPGWPLGPGDEEAGLDRARAAVKIAPNAAANQLVLGEALATNGHSDEARGAYTRALQLAMAEQKAGDPDASRAIADAQAGLKKL